MSFVERQNLTMRMHMRRFKRFTNALSKKFDNHAHIDALYTVLYNFFRIHKMLRASPTMDARISDSPHNMEWIAELVDARAPKLGPPTSYKKKDISN